MIKITERDKEFLLKLNETGACDSKMPLTIYPKRYARTRMEKMEKEKIIHREYDLITLASKGEEHLKGLGVEPKTTINLPRSLKKRLSKAMEFTNKLINMEITTSAEYKKLKNLNRGMQFVAAATTKENETYLIYDIPKSLTLETKEQILKELRNKKNVIDRAILFTTNKCFVQSLYKKDIYVSELLAIPDTNLFIELLNQMSDGGFDEKVIVAAFPKLAGDKVFNEKRVQYKVQNNTYINMVLNNLSVFSILQSLERMAVFNHSSNQAYIMICLDNQKTFLEDTLEQLELELINIKIKTLSIDEVF